MPNSGLQEKESLCTDIMETDKGENLNRLVLDEIERDGNIYLDEQEEKGKRVSDNDINC